MNWLGLTLLSAFALATADALSKRYLSHYRPGDLVLVRFGIAGTLLLPVLLAQPWPVLTLAFWGWIAILMPLEITAMWLYMRAIRESPLSLTLPYLAFTPVFNILTGYVFLGERVSQAGSVGILLVVSGAWLLNVKAARHNGGLNILAPFRAIVRERGSRLMLMTAAIYSFTSVLSKAAMLHVTPAFFGPFYFVALAVCDGTGIRLARCVELEGTRSPPLGASFHWRLHGGDGGGAFLRHRAYRGGLHGRGQAHQPAVRHPVRCLAVP